MDKFADEVDLPRHNLISLTTLPEAVLHCHATELWQYLGGPTLVNLKGEKGAPLFVTILLHGNEHTGFEAMQHLLKRYQSKPLPRPLLIFFGNISAAKANTRTLSNQLDFNRCWPGTPHTKSREAGVMKKVTEIVKQHDPFASIDIHNNTGKNPHYGCINKLAPRFIHLAKEFARDIVFFERPLGVQSAAMAEICPAVTIECGRVGESHIIEETADYVDSILKLSALPSELPPCNEFRLLQTHSIIKVPKEASFSFNGKRADFIFRPDLDELNFQQLRPGVTIGQSGPDSTQRLIIESAIEGCAPTEFIDCLDGKLTLTQSAIPAMLTLDTNAIRSDCLGYLMQEINEKGAPLT